MQYHLKDMHLFQYLNFSSFISRWSQDSRKLLLVLSGPFALYILQTYFWWSKDNVAYKNMDIGVRLSSFWFWFSHLLVKWHLEIGFLLKYIFFPDVKGVLKIKDNDFEHLAY